ncbi:hypothetical protein D3C71_1747790 [compost metagenome]
MKTATDVHKTTTLVPETGTYICEQGEKKDFREGELFSNCPVNDDHTSWRHADHVHKSGRKVTEAGEYQDADGQTIHLKPGDTFPNCPHSGEATTWKHT